MREGAALIALKNANFYREGDCDFHHVWLYLLGSPPGFHRASTGLQLGFGPTNMATTRKKSMAANEGSASDAASEQMGAVDAYQVSPLKNDKAFVNPPLMWSSLALWVRWGLAADDATSVEQIAALPMDFAPRWGINQKATLGPKSDWPNNSFLAAICSERFWLAIQDLAPRAKWLRLPNFENNTVCEWGIVVGLKKTPTSKIAQERSHFFESDEPEDKRRWFVSSTARDRLLSAGLEGVSFEPALAGK